MQSILNFEVINMPGETRITHLELAKKLKEHFKEKIEKHLERRIRAMFERGSVITFKKEKFATYKLKLTYPQGGIKENPREKQKIETIISEALDKHRQEHPHLIIEPHDVETLLRESTYKFTVKPNPDFKEN